MICGECGARDNKKHANWCAFKTDAKIICGECGTKTNNHTRWCPLKSRWNPESSSADEERKHRDLNKVRFGVVFDPDELHPAARREWELQKLESRWRLNPWFDTYLAKDLYRGDTTAGRIGGSGLGVLGTGVYLTWDENAASGFARIAADKYGGEPIVNTYSIALGLNILERHAQDWVDVMASLGLDQWANMAGETFSAILTSKFRELGYDGVISSDPYDGLVIFDSENVIGYVDTAKCDCGKRKLKCERCDHWWCAFGCERQYEACPECSICKKCDNDELEECYECEELYCIDCEGYDCPKGCD